MTINIGDIFWIKYKSDLLHPHVVVQDDNSETIKVCPITTNHKKLNMPGVVVLEMCEGNLEKLSIVEAYNVLIIEKVTLGEYIGTLSINRVKQILSANKFIEESFLSR